MRFQKGQLVETGHECLLSAPTSPLKNMDAPSPATAHAHEMHEIAGSISNTRVRLPVRDVMKKRLSTKPGWGRTAPLCSVGLSGCASSWLLPTVARR
jgi:hypothetical protein